LILNLKSGILASYEKENYFFVLLSLLLAVAGTAVYVLTNLDSLVKAAIEKFGSQAAETAVRVSSVRTMLPTVSIRFRYGTFRLSGENYELKFRVALTSNHCDFQEEAATACSTYKFADTLDLQSVKYGLKDAKKQRTAEFKRANQTILGPGTAGLGAFSSETCRTGLYVHQSAWTVFATASVMVIEWISRQILIQKSQKGPFPRQRSADPGHW
jgi:hypothetical protein